jgi:hypothetical protein
VNGGIPRDLLIDWLRHPLRGFSFHDGDDRHDLYRKGTVIVSVRKNKFLKEEHAKDVLTKSGASLEERDKFIADIQRGQAKNS